MLILTRRPVESICIGDEVTITVLGVVGNQVRFGIEAPRKITIDRAEIHERKKRAAANGSGASPGEAGQPAANGNRAQKADTPLAEEVEVNGNVVAEATSRR